MPQPDYSVSVRWLKWWAPKGPWALVAIEPDKKVIEADTFYPKTQGKMLHWLTNQGATRNIYFSVNPVSRPMSKKANREDILQLEWLHVDLDPRAGEDLSQEQDRIRSLLQNLPHNLPPLTALVFSGGGYQGFWRLEDPFPTGGDLDLAEKAKRYNLQIERLLDGDGCHNIDRIMRLPGSVNRPDAKKRKRGQKPVVAQIIEQHEDRVYPLSKFTPAPLTQAANTGFSGQTIQISGNIKRLDNVDELPDSVANRTRIIIVQGHDPENPRKHPSRSEWLFGVCCELVRAGVDDETIYSVITDPGFGISESVLDKGSGAEAYAIHQIERAREEAVSPWLRKLNEEHAVIEDTGGQCRVVSEVTDMVLKRTRISRQSFGDFRNRYMHIKIQIGESKKGEPIFCPLGKWWLEHPDRRQYKTMVFAPNQTPPGSYNLWKGFACEAKPGDCGLFLDHVYRNICDENDRYYDYLMGWMASGVQYPDRPGHTAIVLRGRMGTGKSFMVKTYGSLFGRHFLQVSNPQHLVGHFNAHLRDCVVLFGDEAFYAGDKKHESVLKTLVTEEMLVVEAKGVDIEASPNFVHLLMASNEHWAVPAALDDRRFCVLDVRTDYAQNTRYFEKIQKQLDSGGREALLHILLTWDLSNFNVRERPKTPALHEQKLYTMTPDTEWWFSKLWSGQILPEQEWCTQVRKAELQEDFARVPRQWARRSNNTQLGLFLSRWCPPGFPQEKRVRGEFTWTNEKGETIATDRAWFYVFPPLSVCRDYWSLEYGGPYKWPDMTTEEGSPEPEIPF